MVLLAMMFLDNNNGLFGATVAGTDPRSTGGHPKLQQKKGDSK